MNAAVAVVAVSLSLLVLAVIAAMAIQSGLVHLTASVLP